MEHPQRFQHAGHSTQSLLDAKTVLKTIGLKAGDVFLDAGSGSGYLSLAASEIVGEKGKVYAVDIDEPSIDILKKEISDRKIKNIESIVADMTDKTPLATHSIDICLMANVLHGFVENQETTGVMIEITRVLKFGGTLAIVEFKKTRDIPGPPLNVKLSPQQVAAVITPYRYRKEQVVEVGPYHYVSLFIKK
ncbi:MAG: hypothetical protein A2Z28_07235 [Chloroflexi bacterium RBG_16_51_9]|nr:MAG: hypothetical protein A2Z28_07235 [Chloroflexi bacterium RBG_16_51_9]